MSDSKIKLGTVGSRNGALRALTNGGAAYVPGAFLDHFAKKRSEDYILCLESAAKMNGAAAEMPVDQGFSQVNPVSEKQNLDSIDVVDDDLPF